MTKHIKGLISAPFTAMNPDCSVNLEVIERQAKFLDNNGVEGAFICGTTGESMSLTTRERTDIAARWADVAPDGLKVIVHVGDTCLEDCKTLAAHSQEIGAWGIGAMAPCFFRPNDVGDLVDFSAQIAASAPSLPFYYYHMPSMTHVNFPMISFLEQASDKIPNLAGIKYTYEDLMDFQLCLGFEDGRFDILYGRDETLICGLSLGVCGAVGSTYNFASPLYNKLIEAFESGDLAGARKLQKKAVDLIQLILHSPGSFHAVCKSIMTMLGIDCGPVRSPLANITPIQYETLKTELEGNGFFKYGSQADAGDIPRRKGGHVILETETKAKRKLRTDSFLTQND